MNAHTPEEFTLFLSQLIETNATLDYYTDFTKCYENVRKISMKLHQLNYLIGKKDINDAIGDLWEENPKVFSVLGILIAVRKKDHKKVLNSNGKIELIESYFDSKEGVIEFVHETGLDKVFCNKQITNLVDYVFGVEVGLDSNARKNRSGNIMENTISRIFDNNGISYREQVESTDFPELHSVLGDDVKRFDFAIVSTEKTYLIEVNYYGAGGSKLNEVARSYTELAQKINACSGYEFVWITDGKGWINAKNKLEEAFHVIPSIYNLSTLRSFIARI